MTSLLVQTEHPVLDVRQYDRDVLWDLAQRGCPLYWEVEGMIGKVPASVLGDTLQIVQEYETLQQFHPEAEAPRQVGRVYWDQCRSTRTRAADCDLLHPHQNADQTGTADSA